MSEAKAAPPKLFTAEGTPAAPDHPALLGGQCKSCGRKFFPMQTYGCEKCGSTDLEPIALTGRGKLIASAKVIMSANPNRPAPFVVGSVVTEDGVFVRSLLEVPADTQLAKGTAMVTTLVPETRPDHGETDLRFKLAEGA
ncbi:zinc ribbon domain-containing protein [Bradyrhizobium sp. BR13661]|jgi:uncharacterized OB-fold protein|uniref:Zn-ribbon domain-containing OB-fold protein n=1 Tax=Bradyrhizobium sp. BR13661 TaxID=2940622 RepID=UPI0024745F15|nr:zinc ribbon domain-containing protein [Bradyrhizobium sp. BR13661]MDH6260536.1 putative OB-fold protein [Bradyrhizobium sp. BR13661]